MDAKFHIELTEKYGAHNYKPLPVVLTKGEGVWVWDVEGNKYIDMLSSYSALNQGHRHPKIIKAVIEQLERITLTSRAFYNDKLSLFLKKLNEITGYDKALPMNSGAEAVETAIKIARKWAYTKKGIPLNDGEIIVALNNFHGRTITIISFSSEHQYRYAFGPFTPGFVFVPFGDYLAIEKAINDRTIGVLIEPIQGEGGIIVPPEGYLKKVREITREKDVLLMLDEIQTGLGRTGKLFAYQHELSENEKPDILILGKALGGGIYPVSVVLADDEIMEVIKPGDHGSTFGGNPLAAAIGIAALEVIIEENLPENARIMGDYFIRNLREIKSPYIKEVRGKGLLIGVELNRPAREFCEKLMKLGVLSKETHEYVIRFAPPLIIKKEEIDWALERIKRVLS
ncbi:MAG: ornithine--oxo-acid transaminase [Candidatus Hydrothermia bacterium]|jgi:ornithine--oxo-acid transaminase|nr:ornithine--oxo-acid transaminase [Candidatus Hydrothermia bacterium]